MAEDARPTEADQEYIRGLVPVLERCFKGEGAALLLSAFEEKVSRGENGFSVLASLEDLKFVNVQTGKLVGKLLSLIKADFRKSGSITTPEERTIGGIQTAYETMLGVVDKLGQLCPPKAGDGSGGGNGDSGDDEDNGEGGEEEDEDDDEDEDEEGDEGDEDDDEEEEEEEEEEGDQDQKQKQAEEDKETTVSALKRAMRECMRFRIRACVDARCVKAIAAGDIAGIKAVLDAAEGPPSRWTAAARYALKVRARAARAVVTRHRSFKSNPINALIALTTTINTGARQ